MKKLVLCAAFMLFSGFAFAEEVEEKKIELEQDYDCKYTTNTCNQLVLVCWPSSRAPRDSDFSDLDWSCPDTDSDKTDTIKQNNSLQPR